VYLQETCPCTAIDHLRCRSSVLRPIRTGSGVIALSRLPQFHVEFYCVLTLRAPKNAGLILRLNHLDIPVSSKGCKAGMLKIHRNADDVLGRQSALQHRTCTVYGLDIYCRIR
jgi:hypothetical protein